MRTSLSNRGKVHHLILFVSMLPSTSTAIAKCPISITTVTRDFILSRWQGGSMVSHWRCGTDTTILMCDDMA